MRSDRAHVSDIAARRSWPVDVHPLPPLLHNRPERIAAAVEQAVTRLRRRYAPRSRWATPTAAPTARSTRSAPGWTCARLPGAHCYDVFAGAERFGALLAAEPGTYVLTDYLVTSFTRSVVVELGLDRYPELRDVYFGHYRRVVWLAQHPTPRLRAAAEEAAELLGLPLETVVVGDALLEEALAELL